MSTANDLTKESLIDEIYLKELSKNCKSEKDLASVCTIKHISMAELLTEVHPDCIITDPTYSREYLSVYEDYLLGKIAKERLKDSYKTVEVTLGEL